MSQKAKRKTIHKIEYWSSQIYSGRLPTTMVCGTMPFEKEFETFPPPEHCTSGIFRHIHPKPESLISHYSTPSLEKSRIHYLFSIMHLLSLIFHYILFTGSHLVCRHRFCSNHVLMCVEWLLLGFMWFCVFWACFLLHTLAPPSPPLPPIWVLFGFKNTRGAKRGQEVVV